VGSVVWQEHLGGFLSLLESDFNQTWHTGAGARTRVDAQLRLVVDDMDAFVAAPVRTARVVGQYVDAPALGGRMEVLDGTFELLVPCAEPFDQRRSEHVGSGGAAERGDHTRADVDTDAVCGDEGGAGGDVLERERIVRAAPLDRANLRMRYRLRLRDFAGDVVEMVAFKVVENDPGYDSWLDVTTLFARFYEGTFAAEAQPLASAVMRISVAGFARELASFTDARGSRRSGMRDILRYGAVFAGGLARVYAGRTTAEGRPSFPCDRPQRRWRPAPEQERWHLVPERARTKGTRQALERRVIAYRVPDLAFDLNLHRMRFAGGPGGKELSQRPAVLLSPGAGLRAEMYYAQPSGETLVDSLLAEGYDVWVQNWRGSIDLPANSYTLDAVARHDHPCAVRELLQVRARQEAGDRRLRAVVHCQGSVSFVMAAAAGFLPPDTVTDIVSSGISLFFDVPAATLVKQRLTLPLVRVFGTGADPQWALRAQTPTGAMLAQLAARTQRQCGNGACQVANFIYGQGKEVLLLHENVDDDVHAWGARELGYSPFSLIDQVAESCRVGHIVPADLVPGDRGAGASPSYVVDRPRSGATHMTFIGGEENQMFLWQGQERSDRHFKDFGLPSAFVRLPEYGHLDTFWGRYAASEVFPVILEGLRFSETGKPPRWRAAPRPGAARRQLEQV
jgi:hypothetical protein